MKHILYIFLGIVLITTQLGIAQNSKVNRVSENKRAGLFTIKGEVKSKETNRPISEVRVRILGGRTIETTKSGRFNLEVKIGDEIIIEHPEIETVYYTIVNDEDIEVLVEDFGDAPIRKTQSKKSKRNRDYYIEVHQEMLDSALYYKKKDIDKSQTFVERSLQNLSKRKDKQRLSDSYTVLGDVYLHWLQYDLAISNYKSAIQAKSSSQLWLKLGEAYLLNKEFEQAKASYETLLKDKALSRYQKINAYEGLADAFNGLENYDDALTYYNRALKVAQEDMVTPKITNLNSKIAATYASQGNVQQAEGYFTNSLNLATEENVQRAVIEQDKVADFYNSNNLYDKEIELRKQSLKDVESSGIDNKKSESSNLNVTTGIAVTDDDDVSTQKINYKIAKAFISQDKYEEAIPYLKKSISEAEDNEDLIVKKDATRKLSEAFEEVGKDDKALQTYRDYVNLVDFLYLQKEQEISRATRFSKSITEKQNRITSLEKDRELREAKILSAERAQSLAAESNKRQQIIIYSLITGMLLLALTVYLLYRNSNQQRLANNLLALKSLRSQMNPHFIFNALNSVNNYIAINDERKANRYLSEFSTLMRSVLENSDEDFIPLAKELELLELYVKLEHLRFTDKFDYEINVHETVKVADFQIPPMLLQPYIENAIWHGLRYKEEKGILKITIFQKDKETLVIQIEDNGIGRERSKALKTKNQLKQKSKGMGNIKKRIEILNDMYKDKVDVFITDVFEDGQGTKVELTLKKD